MGRKATIELVLDCHDPIRVAPFWREALDYRDHYVGGELVVLVPKDGVVGPPLLLQRVPEDKSVKNRMHLDVIADDIESEVRRLEGLGADRIDGEEQSVGGVRWVRLRDPEQNEFCVSSGIEW